MTNTEQSNPTAEQAAKRRGHWEEERVTRTGFWTKLRFDLIDLIAIFCGINLFHWLGL
jgi:hypothetical protein